jgi:hypothetical protein
MQGAILFGTDQKPEPRRKRIRLSDLQKAAQQRTSNRV